MEPLRLGRDTHFPEALKKHPGMAGFGVGRELKTLSTLLRDDEFVLDILQGGYGSQTGILVRTTTRLLFYAKGMVSTKLEEFPLDKVTSVQYTTGLMMGDLTIFASGNKAEIKATTKAHTKEFADGLRSQLAAFNKSAAAASHASEGGDAMVQLEKLASMKERGLLSDEEFVAGKRRILGI